jgi:trehalose/maltose hydrolase-like predicted phosphorylase
LFPFAFQLSSIPVFDRTETVAISIPNQILLFQKKKNLSAKEKRLKIKSGLETKNFQFETFATTTIKFQRFDLLKKKNIYHIPYQISDPFLCTQNYPTTQINPCPQNKPQNSPPSLQHSSPSIYNLFMLPPTT